MSESVKTSIYVVAAVLVLGIALLAYPKPVAVNTEDETGQKLFPKFTDPLAATTMEIIEYDEETATRRPFKVSQVKGRWSIPSHQDYPADAKDHMAAAAGSLMDLEILNVVSSDPGDHALYGVVDPDEKGLSAGAVGVGKRITLVDKKGAKLAQLVIGKEVKDKPELRYVRRVGQDQVYKVTVQTDKLSTKFADWIEPDLLKMSGFDVKQVVIRDHSVDEVNQSLIQRGEMALDFDDTKDPKWTLAAGKTFADGKWTPMKLSADEELNADKLNELKNALADLKIVDVSRKPQGLSAGLRADEKIYQDRDAASSLADRGFYFAKLEGNIELFSNEGEIRSRMKDGVEYILRFGEIATDSTTSSEKAPDKKDAAGKAAKKEDKPAAGLNRYLFVTAEFNEDLIPKPVLEPLPDEKAAAEKKAAEKKAAESKPGEKKPDAKADDKKAETAKPEDKKADAAKPEDKKAEAKDAATPDDKKADAAKPGEKKDEAKKADAKPAKPVDEAKAKADLKAERKRIETENKRKQDEYNDKVDKGRKRVKELTDRFAPWYYIISDDVYRKIHLGQPDVVKKKDKNPKPKDAAAPDMGLPAGALPPGMMMGPGAMGPGAP
ncbi:MAG: DUF4340 domain-containing protein [Pirellulales bacterium]